MATLDEPMPPPVWEGMYWPTEVARYLKASVDAGSIYPLSSTTLVRWIRQGLVGPGLARVSGQHLPMAFDDLISIRVIASLRKSGVSWPTIRATERWLLETTGVRRPLATETLWAGQGEVFTEWGNRLVSGSRRGQMALDMLRQYLIPIHGLSFDEESGEAVSWEPYDGIVLQPRVQFGAPCLKGTRIPTRSLAGMVEAGDPVEWVADAYKLAPETVQAACDWEHRLQPR